MAINTIKWLALWDIAAIKNMKTFSLLLQAFQWVTFNQTFAVRYTTSASENHFDITATYASKFHRGQAADKGKEMPGEMFGKYCFTHTLKELLF